MIRTKKSTLVVDYVEKGERIEQKKYVSGWSCRKNAK